MKIERIIATVVAVLLSIMVIGTITLALISDKPESTENLKSNDQLLPESTTNSNQEQAPLGH